VCTYFTNVHIVKPKNPEKSRNPEKPGGVKKTTNAAWIQKECGDMNYHPETRHYGRYVQHEIPLYPNPPPPFKGIFRLSQAELQELSTQLHTTAPQGWQD
jgi:hypothetical protein